jgi:hypothetical protein
LEFSIQRFLVQRIRRKSQVSSPLYGGFEHSLVR